MKCLNPCSNGTLSDCASNSRNFKFNCLNPYSNGRYSRREYFAFNKCNAVIVLILILMEDALGVPGYKLVLENGNVFVVMEYKNTKIVFPEGSDYRILSAAERLTKEGILKEFAEKKASK